MKRILAALAVAGLVAAPAAYAGDGKGKGKHERGRSEHRSERHHDWDRNDRGHRVEHYYSVRGKRYKAHRGRAMPAHLYRSYSRGQVLPVVYRQYVIVRPQVYYLPPPPRGHEWVQVGSDVYLRQTRNGVVIDLIRGVFF